MHSNVINAFFECTHNVHFFADCFLYIIVYTDTSAKSLKQVYDKNKIIIIYFVNCFLLNALAWWFQSLTLNSNV